MESIKALERAWIRNRALTREILDDVVRSTYSYALRLASTPTLKTRTGIRVDIAPQTEDFRRQLSALMTHISDNGIVYPESGKAFQGVGTLAYSGKWRRPSLVEAYPEVARLLNNALSFVFRAHPELDEYAIQNALSQKALVLALGGGGATGYAHICLFKWLAECHIQPELITGTSFGALLGYARSLSRDYDAAMTMLKLPGYWKIFKNIHPCLGTGRHGLMGICRIDFQSLCDNFWQSLGYTQAPSFDELPIPFAAVSAGILNASRIAEEIEPNTALRSLSGLLRLSQLTWKRATRHAAQIARLIMQHQNAVTPVVFGFDKQTQPMCAIDGVAFSALVPGVLNAEIPAAHRQSRDIVDKIFHDRNLYRLTDGGLTSNVPVRTAYDEVKRDRIRTQNVWILGLDVFAPQACDGAFYPLQQIANENALIDAVYADSFVRLKYLLSPMELAPTLPRMHWLNLKFRKAFDDEMKVIQYAVQKLLPLKALDLSGFGD